MAQRGQAGRGQRDPRPEALRPVGEDDAVPPLGQHHAHLAVVDPEHARGRVVERRTPAAVNSLRSFISNTGTVGVASSPKSPISSIAAMLSLVWVASAQRRTWWIDGS